MGEEGAYLYTRLMLGYSRRTGYFLRLWLYPIHATILLLTADWLAEPGLGY